VDGAVKLFHPQFFWPQCAANARPFQTQRPGRSGRAMRGASLPARHPSQFEAINRLIFDGRNTDPPSVRRQKFRQRR